ncbi:integral membrane protein [Lasiosphaeria hispida]|uniref:Integral membrane protein n=1 Tax=Lasiosphaeria hispida TaxID=260671 RepID=A0AAJ0HSL3_9PEZI|nr:integral membrane protein [Lasiosphaeria hispida]
MASSIAPPNPLPPDENAGPALLAISGILITLILITTSLRLFVRFSNGALGADDYIIAVVAVLCVMRFAVQAVQVNKFGNGRHRWYLAEDNYINNNMLGWYAQVLLFVTMCLLKVSICLLLLRIKHDRRLKLFLSIVMAGLFVTNFGCIVILLAQCKPISVYWTGGGGVCWDTRVRIYSIYFTISYSLLTDVICSLLPLVVVWKVCIPLVTKMSVCGLMSMGIVATGFGVARAASLGLVTTDLTWVYCIAAIWSNLELFLGVIAANLALSRSVYMFFRYGEEGKRSAHSKSSGYPQHSGYINQASFQHTPFQPASTVGTAVGRRPSLSRSESSDIPLEPGIHKKTGFAVLEEYPDNRHGR